MKLLISLLLLLPAACLAQYRITVILDKVPAGTTGDQIYIAGNFNEWNPSDENTALTKGSDGKWSRVFEGVQAGDYEFKFTLGTMESVEVGADGKDIANRMLSLNSDTTIHYTVVRWKNGKTAYIPNTAAWFNLQPPFYSSAARARKPDGAILKSRPALRKS
jgi:hypothetical protein